MYHINQVPQQQPPQMAQYAMAARPVATATPSHQGPSTGHGKGPHVRGKTSPYGFFVKMCYEEHKKKYPNENVQVTEISKKCSEKWRTMSDEEKKRFYELSQKDAERYQAELAAFGGDDGKKKKRAKKDPNAPKRALSAFFFFSNEKRQEVQQQHPEWKVGNIAVELGKQWKALTDEERAVYDRKARDDKERYNEEMKTYREAPGGGAPPAPNQSTPPQQPHQPPQMQHMQQQNTMPPQHMPQQQQLPMQLFDNEHAEYDNRIM